VSCPPHVRRTMWVSALSSSMAGVVSETATVGVCPLLAASAAGGLPADPDRADPVVGVDLRGGRQDGDCVVPQVI